MASQPKEDPPHRKQDRKHRSTEWLDQLLESRYRELFGDDHLAEDIPLVNQLNIEGNKQVNVLQATPLSKDRQYERAMGEYRREKEAEITKYNFQVPIAFPSTIQLKKKPLDHTSPETLVINDEPMEITISPQEAMEIVGETKVPELPDVQGESKRQQKRKCWAYRRKLKHQARTKKDKQEPSTS